MNTHQFNLRVIIESNLIFIVDIVELLLGNVDARFGNEVNLVLFKNRVKLVDGVVESGCFDLASLVHQGDGK